MLLINISTPLAEIEPDEAAPSCPVRKLFLIFFLENSSENTCAGVSF